MKSRNFTLVRILEEKGAVIENRHSGIPTMRREIKKMNLPAPEFIEERGAFKVIFRNSFVDIKQVSEQVSEQVTEQVRKGIEYYKKIVQQYCIQSRSAKEIREHLKLSSRNYVNDNIIKPLIDEGILEYTNKKYVNTSNQRYIIKDKNL